MTIRLMRWLVAVCVATVAASRGAAFASAETPVPQVQWEAWREVGTCGGATYEATQSRYDARNDVLVKVRVRNTTSHVIATRFEFVAASDDGQTANRSAGSRVRPGGLVEGPAFDLGKLFEMAVNALFPPRLQNATFRIIETADVEKLPPYASPTTYLNDFKDFPKETCRYVGFPIGQVQLPSFMVMTASCYRSLPRWTTTCQNAVDALVGLGNTASESQLTCLREWRNFQKCYEVYAFDQNPVPEPDCLPKIPRCTYP